MLTCTHFLELVRRLPRDIYLLASAVNKPDLPLLTRRFLFDMLNLESDIPASRVPTTVFLTLMERYTCIILLYRSSTHPVTCRELVACAMNE